MYKREKKSWLKHLDFTILDIVCLQIALVIAYIMRLWLASAVFQRTIRTSGDCYGLDRYLRGISF